MGLNITGSVSKIISRSIGNNVKGNMKISGVYNLPVTVPSNAETYNLISGIGNKGKFSVYSFRDSDGSVIQHYTRYLDGNGKITDVVTDIDTSKGCFNVTRQKIQAGKLNPDSSAELCNTVEKVEHISMVPQLNSANNQIFYTKSFMTVTPKGDFGGFEHLQKGKKPAGANYKYNWDGSPAKINYRNTNGKTLELTEEEKRYLPFVNRRFIIDEQNGQPVLLTQDFTPDRVEEKIRLAQIIQEKLHNIEGIVPAIKAVKTEDLHLIKNSGKTVAQWRAQMGSVPKGENLGDGQINIAVDIPETRDGIVLLDIVAHEMQHASDFIKMYRGGKEASEEALKRVGMTSAEYMARNKKEFEGLNYKEYVDKIYKKLGIAQKGTPEYEEAVKLYEMNYSAVPPARQKSVMQHDALPLEKRAISREHQQIDCYNRVCNKIGNFLFAFLGNI